MLTAQGEDVFEGVSGCWLRNRVAEVFVSGSPYPRVVAFRRNGSESPFRLPGRDQFYGVRTWFLEPIQLKTAPLPALQPAELRRVDAHTAILTAAPEPETQLQVIMECRLDATNHPALNLRHGLKNLAPSTRRYAAWSIMAFPHVGIGCTPWAAEGRTIRSYLLFPGIDPEDPSLRVDDAGLAVDFRLPTRNGHVKVGTNSDAGWAAYLWHGQALVSHVPWAAGAEYPEGGGTVTLFNMGRTVEQGFCEVEHVGPLRDVQPGATLWLEQTINGLSDVTPERETPAAWLGAVCSTTR